MTGTTKHNGPCPRTCVCWTGPGGTPCQYAATTAPPAADPPALPALVNIEYLDKAAGLWRHVTSAPLISATWSAITVDFPSGTSGPLSEDGAVRFRTSTGRGYSMRTHRVSLFSRNQINAVLVAAAARERRALVISAGATERKP